MTLKEMYAQRKTAADEMKALLKLAETENRDLTAEESETFDTRKGEIEALDKRIERARFCLDVIDDSTPNPPRTQPGPPAEPDTRSEILVSGPRIGKLKAFKGPHAERDAIVLGHWLRSQLFRHTGISQYDALAVQSDKWLRDHETACVEVRAHSGGVLEQGGALVPDAFSSRVIDLVEEYGQVRSAIGSVYPMGSDTEYVPVVTGGLSAYYAGENVATTESSATVGNVTLGAKELSALTRFPISLAQDTVINLADFLAQKLAYALATKEDQACLDGDGTSTYGGIIGIRTKMVDGSHDGSRVEALAADDDFDEFVIADLRAMIGKLPRYPGITPQWYISWPGFVECFQRLVQAAGGATSGDIVAGVPQQFLGYPVNIINAMPKNTTTGDLDAVVAILFGDMGMASILGQRAGLSIRMSDQRYFEYRQIGVIGSMRHDFNFHSAGTATAAGALVGLIGNVS